LSDIKSGSPRKNLVSIDIARAIAALGVFYYHLQLGSLLAHYSGLAFLSATDNFGATYAVPLFFLLSGYCIHLSNIKYIKNHQALPLIDYYKRRLLRIYPAYLVAMVFSIGVDKLTGYGNPVNTNNLWLHLFMLQGFSANYFNGINIVLWTIAIEFAFYMVYPVFYYLRLTFSLTRAIIIPFIVSTVSITWFSMQPSINGPQRYFFLNLWFAWCCGAYLADKKTFNPNDLTKPIYKLCYALILLAFIGFRFCYSPRFIIVDYQINILVWAAPLLLLLNWEPWFAKQKSILLSGVAAIGLSSYSLYLFHEPLISLKNYLAHQLPVHLQSVAIIIGVFLIPMFTWLTYLWFEKPFISKKRKLSFTNV
jgi:peptidoglycan/LPS O-acetylase OafA/YrhL